MKCYKVVVHQMAMLSERRTLKNDRESQQQRQKRITAHSNEASRSPKYELQAHWLYIMNQILHKHLQFRSLAHLVDQAESQLFEIT